MTAEEYKTFYEYFYEDAMAQLEAATDKGECFEHLCETCPIAKRCKAEKLHWGCGLWEEVMGANL